MSLKDQTVWTCDRCKLQEVQTSHAPSGERMGAPVGWFHIDLRYREPDGDLCPRCSKSYLEWWAAPSPETSEVSE